ncbi:MAG TPA: sulfocyanin-like copper-binding protein [Gaiellaceae bacterium]|nr:sulfocyanin-like copper-binding protein [Gaiellaceae bacterium]
MDATQRTAIVTLYAGYNSENNGFNFDGYGRGELLFSIPRGWRVRVTCTNRGAIIHSCAVVPGPMTITPSFRGAATPLLPPGTTAKFSFIATRAGSYRFACLVPGHEEARMWDVLEITPGGKPSISARAGP